MNCLESRTIFQITKRAVVSRCTVTAFGVLFALQSILITGCQDGPMYALKVANPYYSLKEWREEKAYGTTDYDKWQELLDVSQSIGSLSASEQDRWVEQFAEILADDQSAEMRRLVLVAAGRLEGTESLELIETGLNDVSTKVRMEACRSLGIRGDKESLQLLATAFGTETNQDVKNAAVVALASFSDQVAIDSLRIALTDRNPATRSIAVQSLKASTGKNYGDQPSQWIAALDGQPAEEEPVRFADRLWDLF